MALSRSVSSKIALKMLFTGEAITAAQALQHGIISDLVDTDKNSSDLLDKRVNIVQ